VKILLATDAWHPQINGVVRSLSKTVECLRRRGHIVDVIEPSRFRTLPCPTYREIRLAIGCGRRIAKLLNELQPDAIHVSTEGPIGWAVRDWCVKHERHFTTAFHTRFPDYVSIRTGIPAQWIWKVMRGFHGAADCTFTATATLAGELHAQGIFRTHHWPRGVDLAQFNMITKPDVTMLGLPRPILLNVGRVAIEKNIEAFLDCPVEGSKVVVGDGPALAELKARYSHVSFLGPRHGDALASAYAAADVFVFPSRTDTFGLVNIEALACGVPVAAYPVAGPLDILGPDGRGIHGGAAPIGAVDEDLAQAMRRALLADRHAAALEAAHYEWDRCTSLFLEGLAHRSKAECNLLAA
jgi:glycosyltransferase involved in cell wall biosynthesis